MHAQTRRGVDFDDTAALFLQGLVDAVADHIDTADIQTDHVRGRDGAGR